MAAVEKEGEEEEVATTLDSTTTELANIETETLGSTTESLEDDTAVEGNEPEESLTDVPSEAPVSKPISTSMEELEKQLIHEAVELGRSANISIDSLLSTTEKPETSFGIVQMPPINLEVVNMKTQLPVENIEFLAIENSVLPLYEIRTSLDDTVASELLEIKIEPEEYFEARPRFILNRLPSQIKIKNVDGIEQVKEIKINVLYAEVESDVKAEFKIPAKPISTGNPKFDKSKYEFTVPENSPQGTLVGEFHAEDVPDNDDSRLIYSLIGKGSELFFIDAGKITLVCPKNSTCLDREEQRVYYLISFATNLAGYSTDPVTIAIQVGDKNDNPPALQFPEKTVKISDGELLEPFKITVSLFSIIKYIR